MKIPYSQMSPKQRREVDRNWTAAKRASSHRLKTAIQFGRDSEQAKSAWIAEDAAWSKAIPTH